MYSKSLHLPQFQQTAGATPLWAPHAISPSANMARMAASPPYFSFLPSLWQVETFQQLPRSGVGWGGANSSDSKKRGHLTYSCSGHDTCQVSRIVESPCSPVPAQSDGRSSEPIFCLNRTCGVIRWTNNDIDISAKCRQLKKLTWKGTLRQMFIRVYRLKIQSVMSVNSTRFCELLPL